MDEKYKPMYDEFGEKLASRLTLFELCSQLRNSAKAIPRLGIKKYNWWNEALHGVARAGIATVFPQAIAMAASFDPDAVYGAARVISTEARAKYNENQAVGDYGIYKGLTMWSPNINIYRDPRWGRGQETYGEDPYLTGLLAVAFIRGLQEGDERYIKTAACVKHFAAHSGPESERHKINVIISKKDMFETYLPAFRRAVVEGKVSGVMGAYNRLNGEPCSASTTLIKKILRNSWGFDGYYVSDCSALRDFVFKHKVARTPVHAVALAINAGCDLECGVCYRFLPLAHLVGLVKKSVLRKSAARLFSIRYRLGMFDKNCPFNKISPEENASAENEICAEELARKTLVLLENDGILPLKSNENRLLVTGYNAENPLAYLGNYSGEPKVFCKVLKGIKKRNCRVDYTEGFRFEESMTSSAISELSEKAKKSDVVIVCTGLDPSIEGEEPGDMRSGDGGTLGKQGDRLSLSLPKAQTECLDLLIKLNKNIVILNFSGGCMDFRKYKNKVNAIMQCWYPGAGGGEAIASVLFGEASPSGKTPITFYNDVRDLPDFDNYSMSGRTYRYFKGEVQYPFGYGLTYTRFELRSLCYNAEKRLLSAAVENVGSRDSGEVLQLYVSYPETDVPLPVKTLIGIKRIYIKSGETALVEFNIKESDFYSFDADANAVYLSGVYRLYLTDGDCISAPSVEIENPMPSKIIEFCPI